MLRDCQGETLDLIFRAHSQLHYSAQAPVLPHYHPSGNTSFDSFTLEKKGKKRYWSVTVICHHANRLPDPNQQLD